MPGIAHLAFGLMLVIPFMLFAREKFNYKVATIFVLNNWVGPDSYWAWRFIPFQMHELLGFLIWAIPLSLFYSYLSRFSFERSHRFFTIVDDGRREVSWRNSYLLCVGGATFHLLIDSLFHGGYTGFGIFPPEIQDWFQSSFGITLTNPNLADINSWFTSTYGYPETLIIVGFVAMIAASLFIIYYLKRELKVVVIFLFALIAFIFLSQILLGWNTFDEREFAATFYGLFFIFLPLMGFAYVMYDVNKNPRKPSEPLMSAEWILRVTAIIALVLAGGFLFLGLSPYFAPSIVVSLIGSFLTAGEIAIIGPIVAGIAGIGLVGAIGLFFKIKVCRYITIFISILLWFFVFPLAIALSLGRSDVKVMFEK